MRRTSWQGCAVVAALLAAGVAWGAPVLIGDNDGFGGTHGPVATPGQPFVNFASPSIAVGDYVGAAGTDALTVAPWRIYTFRFDFALDLAGVDSIYRAEFLLHSGSVALGVDRGFGHARVRVNGTDIGPLMSVGTGAAGSAAEENVKAHLFDVTAFVVPGQMNQVEVVIDGSPALANVDAFAFDFARLSVRRSCPGDVQVSGFVDFADLNLILSNFLQQAETGDSNGDGVVNFADLNEVLSNYLTPCPAAP